MSLSITSVHNPRVKHVAHLRDRRQRERHRQFVIDGAREVVHAVLGNAVKLHEVFICRELCVSARARTALDQIEAVIPPIWVSPTVFEKLAYGERHDGIVAVGEAEPVDLASLPVVANDCIAVLEGIEKPGNLGAIFRSADAAGIAAVILADGATDLYNPNAIRASLGTIFRVPACEAKTADVLDWLRARQSQIYIAQLGAPTPYTAVNYRGPSAIVLGSEAAGVSPTWSGPDVTPIAIPMRGAADSLNVAAAAAVLFYEARRPAPVGTGWPPRPSIE